MKIIFIGAGSMASALIGGLIKQRVDPATIHAIDPDESTRLACHASHGVNVAGVLLEGVVAPGDVVLLAVKPQLLKHALATLSARVDGALVISIAAGVRLDHLSDWLGGYRKIVRAMPNTPAQIGQGMTGLTACADVGPDDRALADKILSAVGRTVWMEDDAGLDVVTAISGSGPAYVFYFIEALQKAAVTLGLTDQQARLMAVSTFAGAAQLAAVSVDSPTDLRHKVTSKGGTTAAAIAAFDEQELGATIAAGVMAAFKRAKQLGDELGTP